MLQRDEDNKGSKSVAPRNGMYGRSGEHRHCFELLRRLSMHLCDADDGYGDASKAKLERDKKKADD
jgi:hypothetical protein